MSEAAVYWKRYTSVPSEGIDLLAEAGGIAVQGVYCEGSGDLAAMHSTPVAGDTAETIPVVAGQFLPLLANKILEGTTALPLLVLWGNGSAPVVSPAPIGSPGGSASADNQETQIAAEQAIQAAVEDIQSHIVDTLATDSTLNQVYSNISTTNSKLDTIHTDTSATSNFTAQLPDMRLILESVDGKVPADPATVTSVNDVKSAVDNVAAIVATDGSVLTVNTSVLAVETAVNSVNSTLGTPLQEGGNVNVSNFPADPATATNQTAGNDLLSTLVEKQLGQPYYGSTFRKYISMPGGGIDLSTAVAGKNCIMIVGSRTIVGNPVIRLEMRDDPGGNGVLDLLFGAGWIHYGVWGKISDTSDAGIFPLFAIFI